MSLRITGRTKECLTLSSSSRMGEACSHVSAFLFYLEHMKHTNEKELPGNISCTSKLQQWHVPPKRVVTPAPVSDINFRKAEYGKEIDIHPKPTNYDPRQPGDRMLDSEKVYTFLENLKSICPDAGIMHFWDTSSDSVHIQDKSGGDVEAHSLIIYAPDLGIQPTYVLAQSDPSSPGFIRQCKEYVSAQKIPPDVSYRIEKSTRGQVKNKLWQYLHNGRITSSRFHDIYVRKPNTSPDKLVISLLGYYQTLSEGNLPPQLQWGRTREAVAREAYVQTMQDNGHSGIVVKDCGLSLLAERSYLGASSDGRVYDPTSPHPSGVLEIKCPYSIHGELLIKCSIPEIVKKYGKKFFMEEINGQLKLQKTSRYFSQVQGEMAILGVPWCDFVVWTLTDIYIERINFDRAFWQDELLPKLDHFYTTCVVPELLTGALYQNIV